MVTPCMGVWIETTDSMPTAATTEVTPCMGVWIETVIEESRVMKMVSHPVWVCGLKRIQTAEPSIRTSVTPCMGVWIETSFSRTSATSSARHTLYGCVD